MADLTNIIGVNFRPTEPDRPDPPEDQLYDAIAASGLEPPSEIRIDGRLHRFKSGTKGRGGGGDKPGWYVAYPDGVPAGAFGCWRSDISQNWRADVGRQLTAAEEMAVARRIDEARKERKRQEEKLRESVTDVVATIWRDAGAASPEHPYLQTKGISPHGTRITGDGRLMVPMYSPDGDLASIQYIDGQGEKKYHSGGKAGGSFFSVGEQTEHILIAEGFATAATLHEVTGLQCYIAFSASNLPKVSAMLREQLGPRHAITVVSDHDQHGVGRNYADQSAAESGVSVVMPPTPGQDANDYHLSGGDLVDLISPKDDGWLVSVDDFAEQPAPIAWLVKHWIQESALMMVHGPSGGGKTFAVLDMCLRVASGMSEWMGHRVKQAPVVYLAGEGHHGLRGRMAAWKHHNGISHVQAWISRDGCDLNTPQGYQRVSSALRGLSVSPQIIVVDTLHRFLMGDENSAQDTKTMLDACNGLMAEFDCTVILVHHTGVSEEAQHRARGSSAWKGALDIEVSIVPGKDDNPMQIIQRKAKDSEQAAPIWAELQQVEIPGWLDEDGERVTSAVLVSAQAPQEERKESKLEDSRKRFERAWFHAGAEWRESHPYLTRSALLDFLIGNDGVKESTAKQMVKPSVEGKMVGILTNAGMIKSDGSGWLIIDQNWLSSLAIRTA